MWFVCDEGLGVHALFSRQGESLVREGLIFSGVIETGGKSFDRSVRFWKYLESVFFVMGYFSACCK